MWPMITGTEAVIAIPGINNPLSAAKNHISKASIKSFSSKYV